DGRGEAVGKEDVMSSVEMPWGKHRGMLLEDIDTGYLRWVLHEAEAAKPWLKEAVRAELERRAGHHHSGSANGHAHADAPGPPDDLAAVLHTVVKRWFAQAAKKYHPDRCGGDGKAMSVANNLREMLEAIVNEELKR